MTAPLPGTVITPEGPECYRCHTCPSNPTFVVTVPGGASTLEFYGYAYQHCVPTWVCDGCSPDEEEQDLEVELALARLIESSGSEVVAWISEYQDRFSLSVVGSVLQISRQCGHAITWIAVGEPDLAAVIAFLDH